MSTPVELEAATDVGRFGGKTARLAQARAAGLPVPEGLALDVDAARAVASGARALTLPEGRWAVRSSSVAEDGEQASFAGQHLSVLGVKSAAVPEAVARVVASSEGARPAAYRARLGIRDAPRMGVLIQRMVRSDVAGVLFTRHPVTGADERYVEASWGLGEGVVSGVVTPDAFRISSRGEILERTASYKDVEVELDPDGRPAEVPIPDALRARLCLGDAALHALHALASRLETVFAASQDIEWAFEAGALQLLQTRPITTGIVAATPRP